MRQRLAHVALVVRDYDEAIAWFRDKLGFSLIADEHQPEQDKRWVLIAPPGSGEGAATILLARAATAEQEAFIGNQSGGRVFLFLATDDFDRDHAAMTAKGVEWARPPAIRPYGKVAVFLDLYGNKWDLVELAESKPGLAPGALSR
jgi:catechol 2,3-dioxygenase-like lactoylglutathione lyase family enzyme